ncbi:MAG: SMC family ATPase [Thermoplasmata archaeon]|nr:MAG: SMC family ATPase [Thermoplasmata archaeon]
MILKSLSLTNFRKFRHIETDFPDGVIGVFGLNGVGKSTLFEAVAWALYGPVAARTSSDEIKRAGAAPSERCRVAVEFVFSDNCYRVIREMAGKNQTSSAVATMNGKIVANGAEATTKFVQKLLGMDAKSFFTSLFAKQKELNALSVLPAGERKQLIVRMLGIDVIDDIIKDIRSDIRAAKSSIDQLAVSLQDKDTGRSKKEIYREKIEERKEKIKKLLNAIDSSKKKREILEKELNAVLSSKRRAQRDYENIQSELKDLRLKKEIFEKRKRLEEELRKIRESIRQREEELKKKGTERSRYKGIDEQLKDVENKIKDVDSKLSEVIKKIQKTETQIENIDREMKKVESKKNRIESLGPSAKCPTCERTLGEHYQRLIEKFEKEISENTENRMKIEQNLENYREKKIELDKLKDALLKRENYLRDMKIKERELNIAIEGIEREINREKQEVESKEKELHSMEKVTFDRSYLEETEKRAKLYYERYNRLVEEFNRKQEEIHALREEIKEREGDLKLVKEQIRELEKRIQDQEETERKIEGERERLADLNLLEDVMKSFKIDIISRIRPTISTYASKLLEILTDGKYSVLELDENYEILMYDNGRAYNINRFSGGEEDLANLCIRLAISEMLADRAGGEFNFIILDEIFGSQDANRRRNIISALNLLSNRFRQIFIITHIEDVKQFVNNAISVYEIEDGTSKIKME